MNHYIEVGVDSEGYIWITVHSGSRNLGKKVCEYWQGVAINKIFKSGRDFLYRKIKDIRMKFKGEDIDKEIKKYKDSLYLGMTSEDLAFLENENAKMYFEDTVLVQAYASLNRYLIMKEIINVLTYKKDRGKVINQVETIHNYINLTDWIIRKGAISSYKGEKMLIALNMRDGMLLCEGKSNSEWNFSAPHGSGRILSRGDAKEKLDLEEFVDDMKDVYSTSVCRSTIDESPRAYKDSEIIKRVIEPTATILDVIKPIMNLKDREEGIKSWKEIREQHKKDIANAFAVPESMLGRKE